MLKALQIFASNHKHGGGLTGNERGCSERKKLDLASAALSTRSDINPSIYFVSAKGREVLAWVQRPIFGAKPQ